MRYKIRGTALCVALALSSSNSLAADAELQAEINALKQRLLELENKLQQQEQQTQAASEVAAEAKATADKAKPSNFQVNGALWIDYTYTDWSDAHEDRLGDSYFNLFRLGIKGESKGFMIDAQYRWYSYMHVLHHGWIGDKFDDESQLHLGVSQVPFGIQPYASHNFWFGLPYYLGLEDDYDTGLKYLTKKGPWDIQLAFYKNEEFGSSGATRYSFDLVTDEDGASRNQETNQFNARVAYKLQHDQDNYSEIGLSGQWGQMYNLDTTDKGDHSALALHLDGHYGKWNAQLEAGYMAHNPENAVGVSDDQVRFGGFGASALIPSKGSFLVANIARSFPVSWGPVSDVTCYNDYSRFMPEEDVFKDSQLNTTGCAITAGPVYAYFDWIMGKNASYAFAGPNTDDWEKRLNINIGYYF